MQGIIDLEHLILMSKNEGGVRSTLIFFDRLAERSNLTWCRSAAIAIDQTFPQENDNMDTAITLHTRILSSLENVSDHELVNFQI